MRLATTLLKYSSNLTLHFISSMKYQLFKVANDIISNFNICDRCHPADRGSQLRRNSPEFFLLNLDSIQMPIIFRIVILGCYNLFTYFFPLP